MKSLILSIAIAVAGAPSQARADSGDLRWETGAVRDVRSEWTLSAFGDELIVSHVALRLDSGDFARITVEGGEIGPWRMEVSHAPVPRFGDRWMVGLGAGDGRVIIPLDRSQARRATGVWKDRVVEFEVNPENSDVDESDALDAIVEGAERWNDRSIGANIELRLSGRTKARSRTVNGVNEIMFRDATSPNGPTVNATTYSTYRAGHKYDSDIVFWDGAKSYFVGTTGCAAGFYIEDTATHEFGHLLGLDHSPEPMATMYGKTKPCNPSRRTLHVDDKDSLRALYP